MDGRVDVAERPLVGGQLAVRVHVPFAKEQDELALGEFGVDQCQGDAVESEVPGGVPGKLPLVWNRHNCGVVEMAPLGVAAAPASFRWRWAGRVAAEPGFDHVV